MSTVSGVALNAITPTIAVSNDPAQQSRLRRENETIAFKPIEETDSSVASRRSTLAQPGRLEAEQAVGVATQVSVERRSANDAPVEEVTEQSSRSPQEDRPPANAVRADERSQETDQREAVREQQARRQQDAEQARLEADIETIRELAARDREVRAHEQAHQSVGGKYAGAMEFTYARGPDGKRYAVGGEVSIDTSKIPGDPEATMQKADQVRRAALAPAEPSPQDRQVAAYATQIKVEAQAELRQMQRMEAEKAAEERAERNAIRSEESQNTEQNVAESEKADEDAQSTAQERLNEILRRTSETVEAALQAAYQSERRIEIGFNLDTTV